MSLPNSTASLVVEMCIVNLIEEIEKRPALYKKQLKEYSDVNVKKKLWEEVCEAVVPSWNELSAEDKTKEGREVQKRWANLRTCFRRELNAQKNTKSGQAAIKRRRYVYYKQLLFLLPCIENRDPESNLKEDNSQEIDEDDDEAGPSTSTPIPKRKKRANLPKHTDLDEPLLKALNEPNVDEDTNFALSLIPSLQNLTADEKLDAKIGILNVFKQIRIARQSTSQSSCNYN
ncbi:uncharacterized protein [Atheta coriaria]|uniref:uncharacterized protein n=1 Tax=Dalotia coriaria TaxID=877792 RepID=UPI0031F3FAF2